MVREQPMARDASNNYGRADQQAGGSGCPDIGAKQEDQHRNDQLAARDAEQAAYSSHRQPSNYGSGRAQCCACGEREACCPREQAFKYKQGGNAKKQEGNHGYRAGLRDSRQQTRASPCGDHATRQHRDDLGCKIGNLRRLNEAQACNGRDGQSRQADEKVDANGAMREELKDGNEQRKPELRPTEPNEPTGHSYSRRGAECGCRTTDRVNAFACFHRCP